MAYGTVKVDNITFDNGGSDQNVTVSGLYRATTSGVTVTGTISGAVLVGTTTVSGATVTGNVVQGTTVQGISGTFTSLTGTTTTGTTANFASGVFTTRVSGTIITGDTGQFTSGTFVSLTGTTITGTTINGVTVAATTGSFTSLTGTTTSGTTANFVSGVFTTQVSGTTVTGTTSSFTSGNFATLSGATATFTSGVIASGTAAAPSLSIISDPNTGIYSPGADQVAISTNGTGRLFVGSDGSVGVGGSNLATVPLLVQDTGNGVVIQNTASGNYAIGLLAGTGSQDAYVFQRASAPLIFGTNNTERMRLTSAGLLGLGTSSPDALLTVNGIGAFGAGAVTTPSIAATGDLNTGFWFPAADTIAASTGGSERARIDSSGRLLVGTSSARIIEPYGLGVEGQIAHTYESVGDSEPGPGIALGSSSTVDRFGPYFYFFRSRGGSVGSNTSVSSGDNLGTISFAGADGTDIRARAAAIYAEVDGTPGADDMPGRLVFSTTADGAASPTERMRITSAGVLQIADAGDITVGTTTGTKIGTATTQKIGFYNATPVVQPTAVADATDAATVITQLNALLTRMRNLGLIAT